MAGRCLLELLSCWKAKGDVLERVGKTALSVDSISYLFIYLLIYLFIYLFIYLLFKALFTVDINDSQS